MLHCEIMRKNTYSVLVAGVVAVMIFAVGFAISTGNPLVPAVLILAGIGVVYVGKQRVTDVMRDDLSDTIYGKAALNALLVTIIIAALIFAGTMTFYFNSGYGGGFHTYANGSVRVGFVQDDPVPGHEMYKDYYLIADPSDPTGTDFWGLDRLFGNGHRVREFPLAFGAGMGFTVILLGGLYAAFTFYYNKKYGSEDQ
nr:DUF2178 domain-containing protein [uncultured Methanoregula sp.]